MSHALVLARVLAFAAMYRLCYTERYARRWEQKPATDPRWEGVIETQYRILRRQRQQQDAAPPEEFRRAPFDFKKWYN